MLATLFAARGPAPIFAARGPATMAPLGRLVRSQLPHSSLSGPQTTYGCPLAATTTLAFACMLKAAFRRGHTAVSRSGHRTIVEATFVPIDCPRNKATLDALRDYVAEQYSNDSSQEITFIKRLLDVEATERPGIGPMNFGKASSNFIVKELLLQTLYPVNVNEPGRFAESQLDFMKRVIAFINETFGTNFPEDCVIQSEEDPSKFRLVIDKIPSVFEVLEESLVSVISHKDTGVTLTMMRHFPTNFPYRMPSNAYRIKQDPKAIKTNCEKIVQNLIELYRKNAFSETPKNNHVFTSNRSMMGAVMMIAGREPKKTEIFELSGKIKTKENLKFLSSLIFLLFLIILANLKKLASPTNDGQ